MKMHADVVEGRIVGYDHRRGELLIRAPYDDIPTLLCQYMDDAGKIAAANAVRGIAAGIAREKTKAAGPDAGNVRTA